MARYGATPAAWSHFADTLGLESHLLPIVANPNARIAERSTMKSVGKTPSVYDARREVVGLGKWTERTASAADVERWSREPDYAISIQCRAVRAFDIDVPDSAKADAIEHAISGALGGFALPVRRRGNSGKRLLAYRYAGDLPKRVIPVDGGIVEFLGDGQQFVASGQHESGVPYEWDCADGLPREIPTLTDEELNAVWSTLVALFATGEPRIAREKRVGGGIDIGPTTDSLAEWLVSNWEVYDQGRDGELYLRCPFTEGHSTETGETSTAYFVAGTGGYERGHWVCLHGSCAGRSDHDFAEKAGYFGSGFTALPARVPPNPEGPFVERPAFTRYQLPEIDVSDYDMPALSRDKQNRIETTGDNINKLLLRPDITQTRIALDLFKEEIMWCWYGEPAGDERWQRFTDADYTRIKIVLERIGVKGVGKETIRDSVHFVAAQHEFDSAQEWLARLTWDGVSRIATFLPRYIGTVDNDYTRAVSRYLWTALAGRVIEPGCQADMVPIFYGAQGTRKTSAIKAMAPSTETYTDINLTERDDNLSRRLRGRLICELEELRGLRSRDAEAIKAWITKTHEDWIPKYKEFATVYPRRFIQVGSTNEQAMLADDSGERRWLPTEVATHGPIDVEGIVRDRLQLWAEGAATYRVAGITWEDAERLARDVHVDYKVDDAWTPIVERWLAQPLDVTGQATNGTREGGLAPDDVLTGALGIPGKDIDHARKLRIGKVMKTLGYVSERVGKKRDRRWMPPA